jgi:carbon storage regulator
MLILSRKPGDAILIDGGIRVVVLACDGGGVRLGIEAPPSVGILREEIVRDIADENVRAGATPEQKRFFDSLKSAKAGGSAEKQEPEEG